MVCDRVGLVGVSGVSAAVGHVVAVQVAYAIANHLLAKNGTACKVCPMRVLGVSGVLYCGYDGTVGAGVFCVHDGMLLEAYIYIYIHKLNIYIYIYV